MYLSNFISYANMHQHKCYETHSLGNFRDTLTENMFRGANLHPQESASRTPKIQISPLPSRPARPAGLDQAPKCNFLFFSYLFHNVCGGAKPIVFVIGLPYAIIKHFWRDFVTILSKFRASAVVKVETSL